MNTSIDLSPPVGARMKHYREQAHLTQAAVAEIIGYKQSTLSQAERGEFTPKPAALVRMAAAYGCTVEELAGPSPVCAAAMAISGSIPVTETQLEYILSALIRPLEAKLAAQQEQIDALRAELEFTRPIELEHEREAAIQPLEALIERALAYGPLGIADLERRFPKNARAEIESALCRMSDANTLADGWYMGSDEWIMLEDVPDPIRSPRKGASLAWRNKVKRARHMRGLKKARA